jgi:hypothetical protein
MKPSEPAEKHPVGRPHVGPTPEHVRQLRTQGASWRQIAKALGIGSATAMRLFRSIEAVRPNIQDKSPKTLGDSM